MQQSEFKHLYQMNIRWGDQDILGHVNNVAIFLDTNDCSVVISIAVVGWFGYVKQTSVRIPDDIRRKILHYEQIALQ